MDEEALNAESAKNVKKSPPSDSAPSASSAFQKITGATVRDDFNAINTVLHHTRAAHFIGLWKSKVAFIERENEQKFLETVEAFVAKHL